MISAQLTGHFCNHCLKSIANPASLITLIWLPSLLEDIRENWPGAMNWLETKEPPTWAHRSVPIVVQLMATSPAA
jgi:hypothetical protein